MKLATLRDGSRDGALVVVSADFTAFTHAGHIAKTLQAALDDWEAVAPQLTELSAALHSGSAAKEPLNFSRLAAPLPRAYEWVDGSAYINHVVLVRRARGAAPPETLETDPLVYQGGASAFLGPRDDIELLDPAFGLDFEAEICAVLGDVRCGTKAHEAKTCVRLFMLANDVTLRSLVPSELAKGFGFFNSKPATAFSPVAVTPDELADAFREGRVHLPLRSTHNGQVVGEPDAGPEMHFSFFDLIEHISKTRHFGAGTILGSGTVSNANASKGVSCLAEKRARETIEFGSPRTPFMQEGDTIEIEMFDSKGGSIFGSIRQRVTRVHGATR